MSTPPIALPGRPPTDITPSGFFTSWLPAQIAGVNARSATPMTVRVKLDGADGGAWDLKLGPAGVDIGPAGGDDADVTLLQTVGDWRAIVVGEPGAIDLAPPQASPMDLMLLDGQAQQVLATVKGTVRFEVTGFNGRTWSLTVKLGKQALAAEPDATIRVDAETYAGMLNRTIAPPAAFFSGKVQLLGDAGLAMQLGMAMMSKLS
jgi:hypothetical protein